MIQKRKGKKKKKKRRRRRRKKKRKKKKKMMITEALMWPPADGLETVESSLKLDVALLEISSHHELLSVLIFAFPIVSVLCSLFLQ